MNIFILDRDPALAAVAHHDRHAGKMILESAQMLSTVARERGLSHPLMYRSTHAGHPCTRWLASSPAGVAWVRDLCVALDAEHRHRFGTTHKSAAVAAAMAALLAPGCAPSLASAPQAMPDEFKRDDPVVAYRAYYRATKVEGARWTNRDIPNWI
jgi:hypothetical protein